jgi:hypothetical protein
VSECEFCGTDCVGDVVAVAFNDGNALVYQTDCVRLAEDGIMLDEAGVPFPPGVEEGQAGIWKARVAMIHDEEQEFAYRLVTPWERLPDPVPGLGLA